MYLGCRRCATKTRHGYALHCGIIWKWVNVPNHVNEQNVPNHLTEQWRRVFQHEGVCTPTCLLWSHWEPCAGPLGGATDSGLSGLDRGRVGQQSLKVTEKSHGGFLHDEPPRKVTVWVVYEGPGWEGPQVNLPSPKNLNFSLWPQPWPGY